MRHDEPAGEAGYYPEGNGGSGGVTGTGGRNPTAGTGGVAVGGTGGDAPIVEHCNHDGLVLAVGQSVEDPRLCSVCTCAPDGDVDCTHCDVTCIVAGKTIDVGDTFLRPDGCTACICTVNGVDCDSSACAAPDPCRDLATEYEIAVGAERWCGPWYDGYTCTNALRVQESLPCGCPVLVADVSAITPLLDRFIDMRCKGDRICDHLCPDPLPPFRCGEAAFCIGS